MQFRELSNQWRVIQLIFTETTLELIEYIEVFGVAVGIEVGASRDSP